MQRYTQCHLMKGRVQQVAWIPKEFAVKGKLLTIAGQDGWRVISTGATVTEDYLKAHERDYKTQRQASDI